MMHKTVLGKIIAERQHSNRNWKIRRTLTRSALTNPLLDKIANTVDIRLMDEGLDVPHECIVSVVENVLRRAQGR